MLRTTNNIVPSSFLQILRQVCSFLFLLLVTYIPQKINPQFAETDRSDNPMNALRGLGYAHAIYTQKSRLTRLPSYLSVHMVRFAWKADIGRKAKILVRICLSLVSKLP